jgi:hypothetical protein
MDALASASVVNTPIVKDPIPAAIMAATAGPLPLSVTPGTDGGSVARGFVSTVLI